MPTLYCARICSGSLCAPSCSLSRWVGTPASGATGSFSSALRFSPAAATGEKWADASGPAIAAARAAAGAAAAGAATITQRRGRRVAHNRAKATRSLTLGEGFDAFAVDGVGRLDVLLQEQNKGVGGGGGGGPNLQKVADLAGRSLRLPGKSSQLPLPLFPLQLQALQEPQGQPARPPTPTFSSSSMDSARLALHSAITAALAAPLLPGTAPGAPGEICRARQKPQSSKGDEGRG